MYGGDDNDDAPIPFQDETKLHISSSFSSLWLEGSDTDEVLGDGGDDNNYACIPIHDETKLDTASSMSRCWKI